MKFDATGGLKQPNRETTKNVHWRPKVIKLYIDIRNFLKVSAKHNATVKT